MGSGLPEFPARPLPAPEAAPCGATMNEQAQTIMLGMRAMAKGAARGHDTSEIVWRGIVCHYYPMSNTYGWFYDSTDITRRLTRAGVISLINIELGEDG